MLTSNNCGRGFARCRTRRCFTGDGAACDCVQRSSIAAKRRRRVFVIQLEEARAPGWRKQMSMFYAAQTCLIVEMSWSLSPPF